MWTQLRGLVEGRLFENPTRDADRLTLREWLYRNADRLTLRDWPSHYVDSCSLPHLTDLTFHNRTDRTDMTATSHTESRRRRRHPALYANDTHKKALRPLIGRMTRTTITGLTGLSRLLLQYFCATAIVFVQLCMTPRNFPSGGTVPQIPIDWVPCDHFRVFCEANKTTSHRASRRPAHSEDVCVIGTCP